MGIEIMALAILLDSYMWGWMGTRRSVSMG